MRDGKFRPIGTLRTLSFIGLMAVTGGCDSNAALPPVPLTASAIDAPRFEAPDARSKTDLARNRVWLLTREGVFLQDFEDRELSGTLTQIEIPGWIWAGAPYGRLPDLALGPMGEAVITSDVVPTLWRIDPETLAVSVHPLSLDADTGRDVGFSGLAYSPEHGTYFAVSPGQGSLWRVDRALTRAQKIPLSAPVAQAWGLGVRARASERRTERLAGLCIYSPQGSWTIDLAPDQRSAYLRSAACKAT